jgi:hypothetical protein
MHVALQVNNQSYMPPPALQVNNQNYIPPPALQDPLQLNYMPPQALQVSSKVLHQPCCHTTTN